MKDAIETRINLLTEPKPASELSEVTEPGDEGATPKTLSLRERIALMRAKGSIVSKSAPKRETVPTQVIEEAVIPAEVLEVTAERDAEDEKDALLHAGVEIIPGDMSKPQNITEALVESDRQFSTKVIDGTIEEATDKMLNAEALFSESLAEKSMDRERFKAVYMNTVKTECAGLTLDQIEQSIRLDHEILFDKRTGIQAKLAYRAELLKDETAERRAKALKDDWLFKPAKKVATEGSGRAKSSGPKKPAFDPEEAIRKPAEAKGRAKGLTGDALKQYVDAAVARIFG
jgi:hypothetical protein